MAELVFQSSMVPLGLVEATLGGAPPVMSSVPLVMQQQLQPQWCWAAVTSSVATFYRNQGWTQCRVVNTLLGLATCCTSGSSDACNEPFYLDKALDRVGDLNDFTTGALPWNQVQSEIDGGRPIGVRIGWISGGGHFVAVSGYSNQSVVDVRDPWYGSSSVDYMSFRTSYKGYGQWTHSYRTISSGGQNGLPTVPTPPSPPSYYWPYYVGY
jgi:hypothetical protein